MHVTRLFSRILILSNIALILCHGAFASDFRSPRTAALGGSGHAAPQMNDTMYLNPAFAAFTPSYSISGNWDWYKFGDGDLHGRTWNASLQDGQSDLFQAGLGYTHREDGSIVTIGASKTASKKLGFGLGAKIFMPAGDYHNRSTDAIFSTQLVATDTLQVAFVADNIVQSTQMKSHGFYREFIVAGKYSVMGIFNVYFDPHYAPSVSTAHFGHETGVEFPVFEDFFLRGGFFKNSQIETLNLRGNGWGTGFGWMGPRISLDYGYSRANDPVMDSEHTIGTTIYF